MTDQLAYHPVIKNANFTFLLLELILADQLADLPLLVATASAGEWQYEISTVRAHIIKSNVISSSGQEWQFHISTVGAHSGRSTGRSNAPSTDIKWSRMAIQGFYSKILYWQMNWDII